MGLFNISYIPQENISKLFKGFDMVSKYKENILVITKLDFKRSQKILEAGLKVNTEKAFFKRT